MIISVIVPIYNKQRHLKGCLESLRSQSFSNLQIILVDDCSTDDSGIICQEYLQQDSRFQLITHSENEGQQAAILHALEKANGDWVAFVDADDTLPIHALSTLASFADDTTDIIVGFSFDWDNINIVMPIQEWRASIIRSDVILCTRWAKLYRRSLLDKETCFIPRDITHGEDEVMNIRISFKTEKPVKITHQKVYDYNRNESSLTLSSKWTVEKYARLFDAAQASIPEQEQVAYMRELASNGLGMIRHLVLKGSRTELKKIAGSAFFNKVLDLVNTSRIMLSRPDAMIMKRPSALSTRIFVRCHRAAEIIGKRLFNH